MTDKKMVVIPAGQYLTISNGAYSNYGVRGIFRALQGIDAEVLRDGWLREHPDQRADYLFDESEFLGWVAGLGILEPIESFEWHLSDYSKADEMWVTAPDEAEDTLSQFRAPDPNPAPPL